jgi:hypothetical protein
MPRPLYWMRCFRTTRREKWSGRPAVVRAARRGGSLPGGVRAGGRADPGLGISASLIIILNEI